MSVNNLGHEEFGTRYGGTCCNPNTWGVFSYIVSEFEVSLGFMRPCLMGRREDGDIFQ